MKQKLIFLAALLTALSAFPTEYFVDASMPDDNGSATSWATAKQTIQAAVDLTVDGDTVWVTNGVYNVGGAIAPSCTDLYGGTNSLMNRVCVTNTITVHSMNGAAVTIIQGASDNGTYGPEAVRCAYLFSGASMEGFTLTGGYTAATTSTSQIDKCGGGCLLLTNAVVNSCVLTGNSSYWNGGGVCCWKGGILNNCSLKENSTAGSPDGGVFCYQGGTLNNCTLTRNFSGGAQMLGGTLNNCIVWGNTMGSGITSNIGAWSASIRYTCSLPLPEGEGNICADPLFVDATNGDFQLKPDSPCINAGENSLIPLANDLNGGSRIIGGTVDMGAYEMPAVHYLITTATGTNGSISPENPLVFQGWDQTFSIQSAYGYRIDSLIVDGTLVSATSSYMFTNVQSVHTLSATFTADIFYVDASQPDNSGDGRSWLTAKKSIQSAVDLASDGATVLVTNGVYDAGGMVAPVYTDSWGYSETNSLTNRVCITKAITVCSVNGPEVTVIQGASDNGTNGPAAVRSAYLLSGAVMEGFTLIGGHTSISFDPHAAWSFDFLGGGVFLHATATLNHCVLSENRAVQGGGAYCKDGGTLNNCVLSGNSAWRGGGGALLDGNDDGATLNNCLLSGNSAWGEGGGVSIIGIGTLNNSTLVGNYGGGIAEMPAGGTINNCIVWGNTTDGWDNIGEHLTVRHTCSSPIPGGDGNIGADPLFVDAANGDFRLQSNSPCINWGDNSVVSNATDLDGNPRIVEGTVDMGAYEYQGTVGLIDSDNDGITDDWERAHGGNQNPDNTCSNGVNSILQAYIAGLDPNDPDSKFSFSVDRSTPFGNVLHWQSVSGREYSVYYSTNLVNGFTSLIHHLVTGSGTYIDEVYEYNGPRYYKIDVEIDDNPDDNVTPPSPLS